MPSFIIFLTQDVMILMEDFLGWRDPPTSCLPPASQTNFESFLKKCQPYQESAHLGPARMNFSHWNTDFRWLGEVSWANSIGFSRKGFVKVSVNFLDLYNSKHGMVNYHHPLYIWIVALDMASWWLFCWKRKVLSRGKSPLVAKFLNEKVFRKPHN